MMSKKQEIPDDAVRVLRRALKTKLGLSGAAPAKKKKAAEVEEDDRPAAKKTERFGYASAVTPRR